MMLHVHRERLDQLDEQCVISEWGKTKLVQYQHLCQNCLSDLYSTYNAGKHVEQENTYVKQENTYEKVST